MRRGLTIKGLASAFTLSALVGVAGLWMLGVPPPSMGKPPPPPPPIAVIRHMSHLVSLNVHVSDFLEGETRHHRGRWLLHGECMLGVDLSAAAYVQTRPETREAVLRLEQPRLIASKVDHERSVELYVKSRGWGRGFLSSPQLLREKCWAEGDKKIARLGQQPEHLERARRQAEAVLQQLFQGVGWKVRVEWTGTASGGLQAKE